MPRRYNPLLIATLSVGGGALYGIVNYFIFRHFEGFMAASFLFLVPLVIGVIAALLSPEVMSDLQSAILEVVKRCCEATF